MTKLDKKEEQTLEENLSEEKLNDGNSEEKSVDEKLNDGNSEEKSVDEKLNDGNSEEKSVDEKLKIVEEKLLRVMAEMENQRRRFEKERQEAFEFGGFNFAKESLSLLDNIDRATSSFKENGKLKNSKDLNIMLDGIEIVKKDLESIFKKNGIALIDTLNKKFDPNFHQAMLEVDDNTKNPGTVVQEIQKGYMMNGRLLRPSLVGVTKKKEENSKESSLDEEKGENK